MKKVNWCPRGGYKGMMLALIGDAEVRCPVCREFLQAGGFDKHEFDEFMAKWLECDRFEMLQKKQEVADKVSATQSADTENAAAKPKPSQKEKKQDSEDEVDDKVAALAWLKSHEPTISLLESGSHGKRLPYRCNLCKSDRWPDGKVGELDKLRLNSVQRFVGNHLCSLEHRRSVRRLSENAEKPETAKCMGLPVNSQQSGQLYTYRQEFAIWAIYANFEDCALHRYRQEASGDGWYVQSHQCLEECPAPANNQVPVCKTCAKLGLAHGVAWFPR